MLVKRAIVGAIASISAALCGGLLGALVALIWDVSLIVFYHDPAPMSVVAMDIQGASVGVLLYVVPVWLFVLLPMYCFARPSSSLWSWPICTGIGAVLGLSILFLIRITEETDPTIYNWYVLAAVASAGTCFFGTLFHARITVSREHLTNR